MIEKNAPAKQGRYCFNVGHFFICSAYCVIRMHTFSNIQWLVITVYSQNASRDDTTPRIVVGTAKGNVSCDECEYVYSNVNSNYCYASVDVHNNKPVSHSAMINQFYGVFISAILFGCLVALWIRK